MSHIYPSKILGLIILLSGAYLQPEVRGKVMFYSCVSVNEDTPGLWSLVPSLVSGPRSLPEGWGHPTVLSWLGMGLSFLKVPPRTGQGYPLARTGLRYTLPPARTGFGYPLPTGQDRIGVLPPSPPQSGQATPRVVRFLWSRRRTFLFFEGFFNLDFFTFVFTLKIHLDKS